MSVTEYAPNTVYLGGGTKTVINHLKAVEAITPGMVCEYHNDSSELKWGVHDSADDDVEAFVLNNQVIDNAGIDTACAAGDLVEVLALGAGATFYAIVPSGQNITRGARLQSNGDGKLKALGSGKAKFLALESSGAVTEDTRIKVEVAY